MGCQSEIADLIITQEADYVLALKGNQGSLHQDVQWLFEQAAAVNFEVTLPKPSIKVMVGWKSAAAGP